MYHDVREEETRNRFANIIEEIEKTGLLYPVTIIDGVPVYDGAVSYPAIIRSVHNKLLEREQTQEA